MGQLMQKQKQHDLQRQLYESPLARRRACYCSTTKVGPDSKTVVAA